VLKFSNARGRRPKHCNLAYVRAMERRLDGER
jgi:hypothetical protein